MSKKIPEHLQPLHNELSAVYKDGRFQNDVGETFKTAKEAVEHNNKLDNWLEGLIIKSKQRKYGLKTVIYDPNKKPKTKSVASPKDQHLFNLNFQDELNGIRAGLKQIEENKQVLQEIRHKKQFEDNRKAFYETPKEPTSSGLNYLMGVDDE